MSVLEMAGVMWNVECGKTPEEAGEKTIRSTVSKKRTVHRLIYGISGKTSSQMTFIGMKDTSKT